ncbi:type IV pilus assembly protein PilM [Thalassoglobus polymorphus]|uniref:Competence protein A n=1 Tax=Thalassoglobus polymorphus TaxID=2527994 RepID=A0A517QR83_9PLAN|nr:type IV pilus assembly protein PilM [Thalassoglobus polymorphus]QDT34140.1 Competence protein A [Thalassoglobus polymorphus]
MAEAKAAWGIDIGQAGLKALKVRYIESADQVVAEAFDYIPFPKILSQPDAIPEEIVPQAMETFLARNDLKGDLVSISVPGQSALARFIQLPPVEAGKLHEIVKYEARQQIPFPLEDVIWDYQPLGAGAEEGGFLLDAEVGLFAMKRDQIYQQLRPYTNAKVEVELIQIAPLALYNVVSVDEMKIRKETEGDAGEDHYIVMDMGCDNTTLMVTNGYNVWIRNVPIGGNHFTRALTKEMKLSFAKAEHLKCNATKAPDPRAVFQALRPVFNDYVSEIQRSIGYFSSVNRSAKVVKVIGLGNGFKLAGLQKFLQQNLQYEVERPDTFNELSGDAVLNSPMFAENILSFAVPYGLALQALGISRIQTSLLPPEISTARMVKKKKPWVAATAASMLLGFSMATALNAMSYSTVHTKEFEEAQKKAEGFGQKVSGLRSNYESEVNTYKGTGERLESLIDKRRDVHTWTEMYNAVLDCLPRDPDGKEFSQDEINLRNRISMSALTSDKMADLATWYEGLSSEQKEFMTAEDKESGPSGEGYLITFVGQHWHHDPNDIIEGQDIQYVVHTFLKNLKQPVIHRDGFPERHVRRMGITHPTIINFSKTIEDFQIDGGAPSAQASRVLDKTNPRQQFGGNPGANPGYGAEPSGAEPGAGLPMPGTSGGKVKKLNRTDFTIQFVWKPTPRAEREIPEEETPEAETPQEGGEQPTTDTQPLTDE